MSLLYSLVLDRNARETIPFVAIHDSNTILSKEVDAWHSKCEDLEREIVVHQEALEEIQVRVVAQNKNNRINDDGNNDNDNDDDEKIVLYYAESAALKNERKTMEELERIQSQVKDQDERHLKDTESIGNATKSRDEFRDLYKSQERNLSMLQKENKQQERALEHLINKVSDGEQRVKLAEQQFVGLKDTIRILQEENCILKKENRQFEARFIDEKDRLSSEVNSLNEMIEQLKGETDMLRSLKKQEEKRKSWFGLAGSTKEATIKSSSTEATVTTKTPSDKSNQMEISDHFEKDCSSSSNSSSRRWKFGSLSIVVPSEPKQIIQAHRKEAVCVR
jgi:chromosome segregation ATPase